MKKTKKTLSLVLTLAMVLGCFTGLEWSVSASTDEKYGLEYKSTSGGVEITGYTTAISSTLSIPDEIDGRRVVRIDDDAFQGCTKITEVDLPEYLREIGDSAFEGCTALTKIRMDDNVREIEKNAFKGCTKLESVYFSDDVKAIPESAFEGCSSLTTVNMADRGITSIGKNAFRGCTSLRNFDFPRTVTSIGDNAFYECSSLDDVTIPGGVTTISEASFYSCDGLTDLYIESGVQIIESEAFAECSSLTELNLPSSVKTIDHDAFLNCSSLEDLDLASVTAVGRDAFRGCENLTDVIIPGTISSIPTGMFADCASLEEVVIKSGVKSIGSDAFADCSSLEEIEIPASVTSIARSALDGAYYPVIRGYRSSAAETYAKDYDYDFESLGTSSGGSTTDPDSGSTNSNGGVYIPGWVGGSTDLVYVNPSDNKAYRYNGSIMFDTEWYVMPTGPIAGNSTANLYDIGVVMAGNANTKTLRVYSSRSGIASVSKLANGNYRITGISPGTTYIMLEVWDNNQMINHYSVRVEVKQGATPYGQAARARSYFN